MHGELKRDRQTKTPKLSVILEGKGIASTGPYFTHERNKLRSVTSQHSKCTMVQRLWNPTTLINLNFVGKRARQSQKSS